MSIDWIKTEELAEVLGISPRAVRKAILNKKYVSNKTNGKHEIYVPSLDLDLQQKIVKHFDKNNLIENITYSEEAKKLALTKYNIVTKWRDFLLFYKGTKSNSVKDFMAIHNSVKDKGMTFMSIKNVSPVTMFRWDKKLRDNNNNWQALLNKYHPCCKKTFLSQKEQEVFLKFLLHPNKTNIGKAIKLTKYVLKEQGFTTLCCDMTYRRFAKKYIEEHYDLWVFSREGLKALRDKVIPYIKRDVSNLNVGDVIVGDGHRLAFQVINPFTGKPCRPTLVAYQDWKSGGIVGFEIMIEENTQCIASALRNSIINLGKIPKYIYQDNGKAFKSNYFRKAENCIEGLFVRLGITPIYALPYNAKAKVIERFFREMQDSFERLLPSFMGSCISNQPAYLKRNEKFHKEIHNPYIPTINEVVELINRWLNFHYSQDCPNVKNKTIGEVLEKGKGNGVDIMLLDDLMLADEIKTIGRNGIRFLKSDYYDESLYGLKTKVIIKYSMFDLSEIKVYSPQGKFLCVAKRLEAANPIANYTGEAKDIEDFKQRIKQQKRLEQKTVNEYVKELKQQQMYLPPLQANYNEFDMFEENPATKDEEDKYLEAFKEAEKIEDEIPIFHNMYEKYDYLKNKQNPTQDEEVWLYGYRNSEEYKLIYGTSEC